jgi:hypothetical protein
MIGHASLHPPLSERAARPVSRRRRRGLASWQRRTIEAVVAVLAFAVWGKLAFAGGMRLLARGEGMVLSGHWIVDGLSLLIGISGSIAGVSALWAIGMRAFGRTPMLLVGAPDDSPADAVYRTGEYQLIEPQSRARDERRGAAS